MRKELSDICAVLSEGYGVEAMKSKMFLSDINRSRRITKTWKMMKEVVIQVVTELI
jgi:hypothetical protein